MEGKTSQAPGVIILGEKTIAMNIREIEAKSILRKRTRIDSTYYEQLLGV
jgi:hypothetical protein